MNKNFIMAYSCGKDSTLALYKMIEKGYVPKCLLITTGDSKDSWFHKIPKELIDEVSKSLNIDVIFARCNIGTYEEDFVKALEEAKKKYDAHICVFGDIDLENHKKWDLEMCKKVGLEGMLPLWNMDRKKVTLEFIELGFLGIIKKVNLDYLEESFLGQTLSFELIKKFEERGIDICGENGEYHTFVYDGPVFKEKINFLLKGNEIKENYGNLIIE